MPAPLAAASPVQFTPMAPILIYLQMPAVVHAWPCEKTKSFSHQEGKNISLSPR